MTVYLHDLNQGNNGRLTTSVWDTDVAEWMQKIQNYVQSSGGIWLPLSLDANGNLKTSVKDSGLPVGAATEAKQDTLIAKDFATQATLASVLAKLSADPATETTLAAVLAKIIAAPATEAKQDTLIAKDFATQTTLAAVLGKIIAAPATEAKQDTLIAKDFATQTTLAAILAKLIAAPSTAANQSTVIGHVDGIETLLTALRDTSGIKKITDSVSIYGAKLAESPKTEADAVGGVLTFSENITAIGIYNADTINDGIFTVNGLAIPVPAGLTFKEPIAGVAGATVTVTGTTKYIVSRYV